MKKDSRNQAYSQRQLRVGELIKQNTAVVGENIQFRRFVRFNLGETNV